mmetsp:Transcript_15583/g.44502  ORF Transcript_15583/g.44502 Transcript_15583/m.44502 type:complete len:273 (-) Transcript_15583:159-977(-)
MAPANALRPVGEDGATLDEGLPPFEPDEDAEGASAGLGEYGRNSIMIQRAQFEQLKQKFSMAQQDGVRSDEVDTPFKEYTASELEQLREENRRLRIEMATLKTNTLQAEEETIERTNEAASLLRQLGRQRAEVDDMRYYNQQEISELRQQLDNTSTALNHQTEELVRWKTHLQEEEQRANAFQQQLRAVEDDNRLRQELLSQLEKRNMDLDKQLYKLNKERSEAMKRVAATIPNEPENKEIANKEEDEEGVLGAIYTGTCKLIEATIRPSAQ